MGIDLIILGAQFKFNVYQIIITVLVFAGGLSWWLGTGNKMGWVLIAGSSIYGWLNIIKPLIATAP